MSIKHKIRKGFTLVELLVTISILAILATVSVVGYIGFIERTHISNDETLIAQLNVFKDAYLVGKEEISEDNLNKVTYEVITQSGVTPFTLQSKSYGYNIFYNKLSEKYILILEDHYNSTIHLKVDLNYHPEVEDDIDPPDNQEPEVDSPAIEPDEPDKPPIEGGNTDVPPPDSGETPELSPIYTLKDFVYDENIDAELDSYCYAENGIIYVGILIDKDNGKLKNSVDLNLLDLCIIDIANNSEGDIISASLNGINIIDKYTFESVGEYTLNIAFSCNNSEENLSIPVICQNVLIDDAIITVDDNIVKSFSVSMNENGNYNVELSLQKVKRGIHIKDYLFSTSNIEDSTVYDNDEFASKLSIVLYINNEEYSLNEILNTYNLTFENISDDDGIITCSLLFIYQGTNGKCVKDIVSITN